MLLRWPEVPRIVFCYLLTLVLDTWNSLIDVCILWRRLFRSYIGQSVVIKQWQTCSSRERTSSSSDSVSWTPWWVGLPGESNWLVSGTPLWVNRTRWVPPWRRWCRRRRVRRAGGHAAVQCVQTAAGCRRRHQEPGRSCDVGSTTATEPRHQISDECTARCCIWQRITAGSSHR